MIQAATLSPSRVAGLLESTPMYRFYWESPTAQEGERDYRAKIGTLLKECAERLLRVTEGHGPMLAREQMDATDALVDRINEVFKLLNRQGTIRLIGDVSRTLPALESQDMQLYMILEGIWLEVEDLARRIADSRGFLATASRLMADLGSFAEAAEERNRLLGLGWESEFRIREDLAVAETV